jgi:hypothetical protein
MPFKKELIVAITEHPILGILLQPYIITKKPNHGFHAIEARISKLNISKYIADFSDQEKPRLILSILLKKTLQINI